MSIEPIGLLTIIAGLICLQLGQRAAIIILLFAALFGAAAALVIGTANIQPGHLLLGFLAISTLTHAREQENTIRAMSPPQPGFWLMCMIVYGIVTGYLMPRLLAGSMPIVPLGTSEHADTGSTVPLGPVSSNFTQAMYVTAGLICFAITAAVASTAAGFVAVTNGLLVYAVGNILFAALDLATYYTGTAWLLEFMRNAKYTLHIEEEVVGLKRIVGSFPEAATFAHATIGALGFTGTLFICGYRPLFTGSLALVSLFLAIFSTSSTALVGTPPVLLILYATMLMRSKFDVRQPIASLALLSLPLLLVAGILALQFDDDVAKPIIDYVDMLVFSKSTSSSGVERGSWNAIAFQNFLDSFGIGVGLGTIRASSFAVALLAHVGIPGTIFYLLFTISAFLQKRGQPRTFYSDVRLSARNACLGLLICDIISAPALDQGLIFYAFAGVCCAVPERRPAVVPSTQILHVGAQS